MSDEVAVEEGASAATAVFYNMTSDELALDVNPRVNDQQTIDALPGSFPYTPNVNKTPFERDATDAPRIGKFGKSNDVSYMGGGADMAVTINVNVTDYPTRLPLLIFLFATETVVVCPQADSIPYTGSNGEVINVKR